MEPVNLKALAKELNLSISTVSRALQDSYEISEATKKKVFDLAKKLNYQPNPYASSLRKQKSKTIAVVIPEIANNFFSLAINGIEAIAQEKGYHVLIYLTHESYQRELSIAKHLQSGRVDGILMSLASETKNTNHLKDLHSKGIPFVFFDRVCDAIETPRITTDDYESGFKATEHLIANGCKRIAYLSLSKNLSISNRRMHGYQDALKKYGLSENDSFVVPCGNDPDVNNSLIRALLQMENKPDGIFAAVEKLAISTYHVCEQLSMNIPNDVKVISFSNLETASLLCPSLTTITQPAYDIGNKAAEVLFKILEKKRINIQNERIVLKSTLITRRSTQQSS
jgi:LacI family transcriptional regulator